VKIALRQNQKAMINIYNKKAVELDLKTFRERLDLLYKDATQTYPLRITEKTYKVDTSTITRKDD
jgi:hypothetical protein